MGGPMEERRKHPCEATSARYQRLLREAEPSPAVLNAACGAFGCFERAVRRVRAWIQGSRKLAKPTVADRESA